VTHTLNSYDIDDGRLGTVHNDLVRMEPVPPLRLLHAKKAYTTRFLPAAWRNRPKASSCRRDPGWHP